MNAYFNLLAKARTLVAHGRNREMIVAQILADPAFDEYLVGDTYHHRLTAGQKAAIAKNILADALHKEAKRLV